MFSDKSKVKVGWIGLGVMGSSMCANLINNGHNMSVFTRTKSKADKLVDIGAKWMVTPKEVANNSDITFTIVGFPEDVREVYFGKNGILEGANSNSIIVDMTTTEPSLAKEIYSKAKDKGVHSVDAPVSGGDLGARNGTLSIMIGGDKEVVDSIQPLLKILGKNIVYQGPAGSGQHTKMCNQITIAGTMIGVCESLLYGYKAGLDLEQMLESISKGAAGCWSLDNLAPRILKRNFDPGFFVEHFIKDMSIALLEAKNMGIALPGLALVHQMYLALQAQGHGKCGTQALALALEHLSNIKND